ncbi:MAG: Ig-like domain-containing protein [Acidobacteria bacterium]|nr:Ig-like domain-containing protein [Acidobacteriota bacterium]
MITRALRAVSACALAALVAAAVACQKVPLLAPSGSTITLNALATSLSATGKTTIVAQVIEPSGTPPHAGTLVTFTTTLGTVAPAEVETDISGRAATTFSANGASGTATITAISGGVSAGATGAVKIAVGAAAVSSIVMSASPLSLPSSGGSSTITATVNDSSGNPLAGIPVTFSTDAGSVGLAVVTTDASGAARTTLTTGKTTKVTATAGVASTSGTTTTAAPSNSITVTVNAAPGIAFTITTSSPVAGLPVALTLKVDPVGGSAIRNVVVNFGDGQSQALGAASGTVPLSHTYSSSGTYTITATVTDSNGDSFAGLAQVTVAAKMPPTVSILPDNANPNANVTLVTFTITATVATAATGATIQSVVVNFGDGSPQVNLGAQSGTGIKVPHTYAQAGSYYPSVTATDTSGGQATATTIIIVK